MLSGYSRNLGSSNQLRLIKTKNGPGAQGCGAGQWLREEWKKMGWLPIFIYEHVQIIAQGPIWGMSVIEETVN